MIDRDNVIKGLEYCIDANGKNCPMACPFFNKCFSCFKSSEPFYPIMSAALEFLKEQSSWISVKDGLPKENGEYIVISESPICKRMLFAKFAKDLQKIDRNAFSGKTRSGWYDYDCDWGYYEFDYVTYWMPRPEPPKEENK